MSGQFLNSEAVFEVIGNYPIVDQFDVLYTNLQSGSYVDAYVTGSMLSAIPRSDGTGFTYIAGSRGRVFSKLGVPAGQLPAQKGAARSSYEYEPWRERSGMARNVKIFSDSERFYDSLLPRFTTYVQSFGGQIIDTNFGSQVTFLPIGYYVGGASGYINQTAVGLTYSFPFEPKVSQIPRSKNITDDLIATWNGTSTINKRVNALQIYEWYGGSVGPDQAYLWYGAAFNYAPLLTNDVSKILFGFGDRNTLISSAGSPAGGLTNLLSARFNVRGSDFTTSISPILRGWKYGLIDGNPHYASCVFRRDRFGQFRDMLEQRPHASTYVDYENAPSTLYFAEEEGRPMPAALSNTPQGESTIQYPVEVFFVKQQILPTNEGDRLVYAPTAPDSTWSSNLSTYATSSLPFFDADFTSLGRNRGPIPETLSDPEGTYTTP